MNVREAAQRYVELGWYPIPLKFGSKDLRDRDGLKRIYTAADFNDTDNIGLQLAGARDAQRPNKLVAVDFDAPEATSRIAWAFLPHTCGWGRASKPLSQILYRCSVERSVSIKDLGNQATLVEVRASHQSMCPPSTHPNGEAVTWLRDDDLTTNELEWKHLQRQVNLVATTMLAVRYYPDRGARHYWGVYLAGLLRQLGLTQDETLRVFELAGDAVGDAETRDRLDATRSTYARTEDDPTAGSHALVEELGDGGPAFVKSLRKIWGAAASGFDVNGSGTIIASSLRNVRTALTKLEVTLTHDDFRNRSLIARNGHVVVLDDTTLINTWLEIEKRWQWRPPKDFFIDVVANDARVASFHPVRDYLDTLRWDRQARVDRWLITYGQAADTPYVRAVGAIVLIAAVRRVRQPGVKFDELMVLESAQGLNKSQALRKLCPRDEWFGEDLPLGLDAKQIIERTAGRWIIEIAELVGSRKDAEHLKASLSRQVDGPVRLAYARLPVEVPRQFIMIGTTNPASYLRDMTGNRRFWPVEVGCFDVDAVERDRDQLWAEAVVREAAGESIRLDPALYDAAAEEQEERREKDPWEPIIAELVESVPIRAGKDGKPQRRVRSRDLWDRVGVPLDRWDHAAGARMSAIMRRLGFRATKVRDLTDGTQASGWVRHEKKGHVWDVPK